MRFEDAVNDEFLQRYGEKFSPENGVVGKDGEINFENLRYLWNAVDGESHPYRFQYALVYGMRGLMGMWETPAKFRGHEDRIYKACLDKGETWKELLDYKEPGKDVLL